MVAGGCDPTTARCETLCAVLEDCDDNVDLDECIDECAGAFAEPTETCDTAFAVAADCFDTEGLDCDNVADDCEEEFEDFAYVCDEEIEDMDLGSSGGDDPCNDELYNSCFGFDGICDEGTGGCAAGTDYSDCYC